VIARLERKEALELLPDQTTRTLVQILIETGLRAIDARTLPLDALSHDAAGAPYLRYFNHKLARERYLPITPALAEAVRHQQDRSVGGSRTASPAYCRGSDRTLTAAAPIATPRSSCGFATGCARSTCATSTAGWSRSRRTGSGTPSRRA
jgi:integrase